MDGNTISTEKGDLREQYADSIVENESVYDSYSLCVDPDSSKYYATSDRMMSTN